MPIIYMVRHAQIVHGQGPGDPGISEQGRQDAEALARWASSLDLSVLYSSPLRRAQETADVIGRICHLRPIIDLRLRERTNWGDDPMQSFEEFVRLWEQCNADRSFKPPVGDSSIEAGRRLRAFVEDTMADLGNANAMAVTHGGLIADFLLDTFSMSKLETVNSSFAASPFSGDVMVNCSVSQITLGATLDCSAIAQTPWRSPVG